MRNFVKFYPNKLKGVGAGRFCLREIMLRMQGVNGR